MHFSSGLTLLELLLVVFIAGVLAAIGIPVIGNLIHQQAFNQYSSAVAQNISLATTQANSNDQVYALLYSPSGIQWGPTGGTIAQCEGGQPSVAPTIGQIAAPSGISSGTGWLCMSPPGVVSFPTSPAPATCPYDSTYTFPCIELSGFGISRQLIVAVSGQVKS
jgi:prepilin-type N-terminal cleavage/methylation domain-containing protein